MKTRYFALILGIVFTLIGIMGFVPSLVSPPTVAPALDVYAGYGYLLGLFPVNVLHNIVHLAFGVLGIIGFWSYSVARLYARGTAIIYGLLTVLGLVPIPASYTTFGLVPIFGNDVWLHALIALASAYFGFITPEEKNVDARTI